MVIRLSHHLSRETPFYSSLPKPSYRQIYDLARGDACNSFYFTSSNHAGTHVDAPRHFNPNGRDICSYEISDLIFHRPGLLDIRLGDEHLICPEDLGAAETLPDDTDILLVRSRFGEFRNDERRYVDHAPGFGAASATYLMETLPSLRAIAVDFVSISSLAHEEEGAEAHRVFLGCGQFADRPVLLVEDVRMPSDLPALGRVYIVPWYFEGLDSAPCVVFGEVETDEA